MDEVSFKIIEKTDLKHVFVIKPAGRNLNFIPILFIIAFNLVVAPFYIVFFLNPIATFAHIVTGIFVPILLALPLVVDYIVLRYFLNRWEVEINKDFVIVKAYPFPYPKERKKISLYHIDDFEIKSWNLDSTGKSVQLQLTWRDNTLLSVDVENPTPETLEQKLNESLNYFKKAN